MKKYIGVKTVGAKPMSKRDFIVNVLKEEFNEGNQDGYIVVYPSGSISWCPKEAFEESNRPTDGMTFGYAIESLKRGFKVAREGWNGKNMYLTLIKPGNAMHQGFDMLPCIAMKTADNKMCPGWLASQTDMLAEDYHIVDGNA